MGNGTFGEVFQVVFNNFLGDRQSDKGDSGNQESVPGQTLQEPGTPDNPGHQPPELRQTAGPVFHVGQKRSNMWK